MTSRSTLPGLALVALVTFVTLAAAPAPRAPVDPQRLRAHVSFLADDLLEGRGPGTRGGLLAERYAAAALSAAGVPGGTDGGGYYQRVPLVGVKTQPGASLTFEGAGGRFAPRPLDEVVAWNESLQDETSLDTDGLVFAGYGIEAPEWRWNDYAGADVKGKVVLLLVGDPPAPADEPGLFAGRALTYHGRWSRKLELAASKGARGALLVHTDTSAGYGWSVVRGSWSGERSQLPTRPEQHALDLSGWLTEAAGRRVLQLGGGDLDALRASAGRRGFAPVALPVKLAARLASAIRRFEAANVIGRLPGTDPSLREQAVIFSAHLDHLGIGPPGADGDVIYNGAVDDASGVACLLEVARTLAARGGLKRTSLFVAFAAEEQGLKGSQWYAAHPVVAPGRTAAIVNMDGAKPWGEVEDFSLMGSDRSPELSRVAAETARALGFRIARDEQPEKGYFYRSDHFSLARVGVPCINLGSGMTLKGRPAGAGAAQEAIYREKRYHRPDDELDDSWDFGALAQYAGVALELGRRVAELPSLPRWNAGDEFDAARKESLSR